MRCPKCQFDNIPDALFCQGCGIQFSSAKAAKPPRAVKWFVIISVCLFVGYLVVSAVRFYRFITTPSRDSQIVIMREAMPRQSPTPKAEQDKPETRFVVTGSKTDEAADNLRQALKETGCQNCLVAIKGRVVSIAHPDLTPEMTVARVLTKRLTASLQERGFTKIRVYQGGSFDGQFFDYNLQ